MPRSHPRGRTYYIGLDERNLAALDIEAAEACAQAVGEAIEFQFPGVTVRIIPQAGNFTKDNFESCNDVVMWHMKNVRRIMKETLASNEKSKGND